MGGKGSGKNSGGQRPNAGRKWKNYQQIPYKLRFVRVPLEHLDACNKEITEVLKKYRDLCETSK